MARHVHITETETDERRRPARRGLLAGLTGLAGVSGVALALPASDPDAELHMAVAAFDAAEAALDACDAQAALGDFMPDAETNILDAAWDEAMGAVQDITPATLAGWQAKARVLIAIVDRLAGPEGCEIEVDFAVTFAEDILGLSEVAP